MKKGINIWSFPEGTTAKQAILMAKAAGFDGLELALTETGEVSMGSSEREIMEIQKMATEEGLTLPSLATGLFWSYSITSSDQAVRSKAEGIVKKQLETAALLGADTILVVPGAVGVDFIPGCEVVSYDIAYERALQALQRLKSEAESIKVSIGLENVWNKFLLSPLEMRQFIDTIDSPYVGAYFDVGNVVQTGYPEQWIQILQSRIKKVHFKDFRRSVGNIHGFVDLLSGDVHYPSVMEALRAVGYDDFCIGELMPGSENTVYNGAASMERILQY